MHIDDWRKKIDELDRRLVELLNERATAAREIGRLKRDTNMRIYEPEREKVIFANIAHSNSGPLSNGELRQVYERIIDIMRKIQKDEIEPQSPTVAHATELEPED